MTTKVRDAAGKERLRKQKEKARKKRAAAAKAAKQPKNPNQAQPTVQQTVRFVSRRKNRGLDFE